MTTKSWVGGAAAVAQVHTGSIDSVDGTPADNTFTVTIGGVAVSAVGDTDVATTATNLRTALNASTHPYFSSITWSGASGDIIGTADTAGVPFVAALTVSGAGTGAVTDFAVTTASEGPSDFSTPENWSDNAVPVDTDTIIFANNSVNVCYGLSQSAINLVNMRIEQTYTGKIGLPSFKFCTSADGETFNTAYPEYREQYLDIDFDSCDIGQHFGTGAPVGSRRLKIKNTTANASIVTVHDTASAPEETGMTAVQLIMSHADHDIYVRKARAGVGIATGGPGETATVGIISVPASDTQSQVIVGPGVTVTDYSQNGGNNQVQAAATITSITVNGGILTLDGDYTVTTFTVNGGTVYDNHKKTSGNAVTTAEISGGSVDLSRSTEPRTWATTNLDGGSLKADFSIITLTAFDEPAGLKTIQVT